MTLPTVELGNREFWAAPWARRHEAFAGLRAIDGLPWFAEPEFPGREQGPGFRALTRHADVEYASKHPELFCSAGARSRSSTCPPRRTSSSAR